MEEQEILIQQSLQKFLSRNEINLDSTCDRRLKNLSGKIIQWLEAIEDEDKIYFLKLFENFTYCGRDEICKLCQALFEKYSNIENVNTDATIYVPVPADGGIFCGADVILSDFKYANDIRKGKIAPRPIQYDKRWNLEGIENVVLIDDVIGTGTTFRYALLDLIKGCPNIFSPGKRLFLFTFFISKRGRDRIKEISKEINREIQLIEYGEFKKAFLGDFIFPANEVSKAKETITTYEERIKKRDEDVLGYEKSQALIAFYYNTPNNTLSTFWCTNDVLNWKPIFPREEESGKLPKANDIKERKRIRKNMLYNLKILKDNCED